MSKSHNSVNGPLKVAVIGAGHRSRGYCRYALAHPDQMNVVAVADPNEDRRTGFADEHGIEQGMRFRDYRELIAARPAADAVVNGTMDQLHHETGIAAIQAGYHMLLEKPIAPTEREVRDLLETAGRHQRVVMICHVLRYAAFYRRIKQLVDQNTIGRIIALHTTEAVSYHHMATAFVRGKWNSVKTSSPMLLAKCCHDLDLIAWFMSGRGLRAVASFGGLKQFRRENAPQGSTERCLSGCAVEATCNYSARRLHVDHDFGFGYPWESFPPGTMLTREQKLQSLRTDNPYGRCVWRCDNDVVDHQSVIVEFDDGSTASHDMFCATARPTRTIHMLGETGEIEGDMEKGLVRVRRPDLGTASSKGYSLEEIDVNTTGGAGQGGHGGGDGGLIADFVAVLRGESTSGGVTRIEDSLTGHLIAFAADRAMLERRTVVF